MLNPAAMVDMLDPRPKKTIGVRLSSTARCGGRPRIKTQVRVRMREAAQARRLQLLQQAAAAQDAAAAAAGAMTQAPPGSHAAPAVDSPSRHTHFQAAPPPLPSPVPPATNPGPMVVHKLALASAAPMSPRSPFKRAQPTLSPRGSNAGNQSQGWGAAPPSPHHSSPPASGTHAWSPFHHATTPGSANEAPLLPDPLMSPSVPSSQGLHTAGSRPLPPLHRPASEQLLAVHSLLPRPAGQRPSTHAARSRDSVLSTQTLELVPDGHATGLGVSGGGRTTPSNDHPASSAAPRQGGGFAFTHGHWPVTSASLNAPRQVPSADLDTLQVTSSRHPPQIAHQPAAGTGTAATAGHLAQGAHALASMPVLASDARPLRCSMSLSQPVLSESHMPQRSVALSATAVGPTLDGRPATTQSVLPLLPGSPLAAHSNQGRAAHLRGASSLINSGSAVSQLLPELLEHDHPSQAAGGLHFYGLARGGSAGSQTGVPVDHAPGTLQTHPYGHDHSWAHPAAQWQGMHAAFASGSYGRQPSYSDCAPVSSPAVLEPGCLDLPGMWYSERSRQQSTAKPASRSCLVNSRSTNRPGSQGAAMAQAGLMPVHVVEGRRGTPIGTSRRRASVETLAAPGGLSHRMRRASMDWTAQGPQRAGVLDAVPRQRR